MKEIRSVEPANVRLDLQTRVATVEEEFFRTTGSREYQMKLCEQLHMKCVKAMLHAIASGDTDGMVLATELVTRMDTLLLKGVKKTKQRDD